MARVGNKAKRRRARIAIFLPYGDAAHIGSLNIDISAQAIEVEFFHQLISDDAITVEQETIIFGENQEIIGQLALRCEQGRHLAILRLAGINVLRQQVLQKRLAL